MWKYRDFGILNGWNGAVLIAALFAGIASGIIVMGLDWRDPDHPFPAFMQAIPFLVPLPVIIVGFVLLRRRKDDDAGYIAKASPPDWRRLSPDSQIISGMQETSKTKCIVCILWVVLALGLCVMLLIKNGTGKDTLYACAVVILLLLLAIVKAVLRWVFWQHPPIETEYAVVDVAYCTEQSYLVRSGWSKDVKLFFFLPDGRYRVVMHGLSVSARLPEVLYFVRLHGVVRWVHWEN